MLGIGTAGLEGELAADTRLEFGDIQPHILTVGVQPTVGSATPGPVALGSIRKRGEQVIAFLHGLCFSYCLQICL